MRYSLFFCNFAAKTSHYGENKRCNLCIRRWNKLREPDQVFQGFGVGKHGLGHQ